ncbi:DUF6064 family protein [Hydrogenophaga sp. R2]|uniref:DUF6064 family protein n=1 Tax=Hydrogenophaga sp. R2 TaxID=3132827 RepID=UPI003CE6DFC6
MDEWWTYRPSDFLMFSPPIYWRLFESLNRTGWPLAILAVTLGLVAWVTRRRARTSGIEATGSARLTALLMAGCCLYVAWAFFWQRFAPIYSAAPAFAALFALKAAVWALLGASPGVSWAPRSYRTEFGVLLAIWAFVGHPVLALIFGRSLWQAEWFGLAPDPTVLGGLALLLMLDLSRCRASQVLFWTLWVVSLLWCAISSLTLWTLEERQGLILLTLGLLALSAGALRRR